MPSASVSPAKSAHLSLAHAPMALAPTKRDPTAISRRNAYEGKEAVGNDMPSLWKDLRREIKIRRETLVRFARGQTADRSSRDVGPSFLDGQTRRGPRLRTALHVLH